MLKRLVAAAMIFAGSLQPAYSWQEIPPVDKTSSSLNQNSTNPCTHPETIKTLKQVGFDLAFKGWRNILIETRESMALATGAYKFLKQHPVVVHHIRHYLKPVDGDRAFCSSVLTIVGVPLVVSGDERRNHIRYIVRFGPNEELVSLFVIDYDVIMFDYIKALESTEQLKPQAG